MKSSLIVFVRELISLATAGGKGAWSARTLSVRCQLSSDYPGRTFRFVIDERRTAVTRRFWLRVSLAHAVRLGCIAHIFLLNAVMSREALMMRSRRSWCSSSSLRKDSNAGMNGDGALDESMVGCSKLELRRRRLGSDMNLSRIIQVRWRLFKVDAASSLKSGNYVEARVIAKTYGTITRASPYFPIFPPSQNKLKIYHCYS